MIESAELSVLPLPSQDPIKSGLRRLQNSSDFETILISLSQFSSLLKILRNEDYSQLDLAGNLSGIGSHIRHCLDHFRALQLGLQTGTVDYEARERNNPIERNKKLALLAIDQLTSFFDSVLNSPGGLQPELLTTRTLQVIVAIEMQEGKVQNTTTLSSLGREIAFVASHAVHHLAIIRHLGAARGICFEEDFGLAPGTRSWKKEQALCAR